MIRTTTVGIRVDAYDSADEATELAFQDRADKPWLMTFANPATAVAGRNRPRLQKALEQFDTVGPDGWGMVVAMRLQHRHLNRVARISFDTTSLAPKVFREAIDKNLSIVLIGGLDGVAEQARVRLEAAYPGLRIIKVFDGYHLTAAVDAIVELAPDIVIAGMGVLVQEEFLLLLSESGWSGLGFTCGGYLDQVASSGMNYYPEWIDRTNLRFVYRFVREPKRLWRRYIIEYPQFVGQLLLALMRTKER
jgi:N-acetylglucosaminyldiphosphoundecaprenol N-acetyl-beta-D-mannosaminyltransferase